MPENLWDIDRVAEYLDVTPWTIHQYRKKDPTFPRAIRLSSRTVRWRPEQIIAWTRRLEEPRPDPDVDRRRPRGRRPLV